MSKLEWVSVQPSGSCPGQRWGHSCCVVEDNLYLFGGFANANYMNDLWAYNLKQVSWRLVTTSGDVPDQRSNATLSYDAVNHQLILFGGGGPNKQRFNCVSVLDLNTYSWVQFHPFENQPSPWERTYHTAEFKYPYLVIFGGEGVDDLGDLWAYNLQTLSWKQIKFNQQASRPQARRFHSSCLVENSLYLFGGCEGKYNCLGDFYKLDLTPLLQNGSSDNLSWVQIKLSEEIVARWGHTSYYYNGDVYVFGGRAVDDLNDLFTINVASGKVNHLKAKQEPKARRRHSGGFIGSCLVLFGGFDGNYFNDLFYINVYQNRNKQHNEHSLYCDHQVYTVKKEKLAINTILTARYFSSKDDMDDFLNEIDCFYLKEELQVIFTTLYRGYGVLPLQKCHKKILDLLPTQQQQTNSETIYSMINSSNKSIGSQQRKTVQLDPLQLSTYLRKIKQHWLYNECILLNKSEEIRISRQLLACQSQFFACFFSQHYHNQKAMEIELRSCKALHFELMVCFVHTKILVMPKHSSHHFIAQMAQLAEYFNIPSLLQVCEDELVKMASLNNYRQLLETSLHYSFQLLAQRCTLIRLNELLNKQQRIKALSREEEKQLDGRTLKMYKLIQFDLAHHKDHFAKIPIGLQDNNLLNNKQNQPFNGLPRKTSTSFQK